MPLRRFGEKLKTSLHHLSPKSKKTDEAPAGDDLSPCSLPASSAAAEPETKLLSPSPVAPEQQHCTKEPCTGSGKAHEAAGGVFAAPKALEKQQPAAAAVTKAEPEQLPPPAANCCMQAAADAAASPTRSATPTYGEHEEIFPTMYYLVDQDSNKTEPNYALRLSGNGEPGVDREAVSIPGDYVERVTVTVNSKNETADVCVDLLEGGQLYDKIRLQFRRN
ncbi:hypothetical protein Efla_003472 [Eimeria flavescens]